MDKETGEIPRIGGMPKPERNAYKEIALRDASRRLRTGVSVDDRACTQRILEGDVCDRDLLDAWHPQKHVV